MLSAQDTNIPQGPIRRDNVMAQFPFQLYQTGKETRSSLDQTSPQIPSYLVLLSRHREGIITKKKLQRSSFPLSLSLLKGCVTLPWLCKNSILTISSPVTYSQQLMSSFSSQAPFKTKRLTFQDDVGYLLTVSFDGDQASKGQQTRWSLMLTFKDGVEKGFHNMHFPGKSGIYSLGNLHASPLSSAMLVHVSGVLRQRSEQDVLTPAWATLCRDIELFCPQWWWEEEGTVMWRKWLCLAVSVVSVGTLGWCCRVCHGLIVLTPNTACCKHIMMHIYSY